MRVILLLAGLVAALAATVWWDPKLGAAFLLFIVAIGAAWLWGLFSGRTRRDALQARTDMAIEAMHREFYADSTIAMPALVAALDEIATTLGVTRAKLRPSDRFDRELAATRGWETDDGLGVLNKLVLKRLSGRSGRVQTVDDYIRLAASGITEGGKTRLR